MANSIKTTGQLRDFLANMLVGVKNGDVKPEEARGIVKMAAQINESFYSEIKIQKVRVEAGEKLTDLGALPIGEAK